MIFRRNKSDKEKSNSEIVGVTYCFIFIFVALIIYISYFTVFRSSEVINNPYNSRQDIFSQRIVRGNIKDRDGNTLAKTQTEEDGTETRIYPFKNMFAHVVGFSDYGKSGIESLANFMLLTSNASLSERISNDIEEVKNQGDTVITTLDYDIQKAAYDAFMGYEGAVIAMNCKTGEILCMVSKPDFDPNSIKDNWDYINSDSSSLLINRATQGLYPPGSTFKIVTTYEYLKETSGNISGYEFDCTGSYEYRGSVINCFRSQKHGEVSLAESFAKSCNSSYANISTLLDKENFEKTCDRLLFGEELPVSLPYNKSFSPISADSDYDEVMQTAIGQGKTLITPIHMGLLTSSIANNGVLMKPYLVSRVVSCDGKVVKSYKPEEYGVLVEEKYASILRDFMRLTVLEGTATKLKNENYEAAGKTGSAEYTSDKSKSHAWFTGFAPYNDPQIVVTVIAEGAGSGGEVATAVAKAVFDAFFE